MTLEKFLDYFRLGPVGVRRFERFLQQCGDCEFRNYRSERYGILSCEYTDTNKRSIASGVDRVCSKFKKYESKYFTIPPSDKDDSSGPDSGSTSDDIPDYENYTPGHIGPSGGRM